MAYWLLTLCNILYIFISLMKLSCQSFHKNDNSEKTTSSGHVELCVPLILIEHLSHLPTKSICRKKSSKFNFNVNKKQNRSCKLDTTYAYKRHLSDVLNARFFIS